MSAETIYTLTEVAKHNTEASAWIVVRGYVYDVTKFLKFHPGGRLVLLRFCGTDCTQEFDQHHSEMVMQKYHGKYVIGRIAKPERKAKTKLDMMAGNMDIPNVFGELIPFGDPTWYQGWVSPYYKESHVRFRRLARDFTNKEVIPNVHRWDEAKEMPLNFLKLCAESGMLILVVGQPYPADYCPYPPPYGMALSDFDSFHELILLDELARCASGGVLWGLGGGLGIGLPPIIKFGSKELKEQIVRGCLAGEKVICLAVTEPWGGSDVANIQTTAKLTEDGKYYIVNGEKKWITNGVKADYFTTAVRTSGPGMGGISLLVIERGPGVTTKQMNCMGAWASGTSYITFEDVKVPAGNLIGKPGAGFKYIMNNFNHERWGITVQANRFARVCLEESVKFASRRRTFGKLLIEQPVIRAKIAEMARQVMATHAALEDLTYQFDKMPKGLQMNALGGHTALLKVQATKTFEFCAREAAQIFGGASYTREGQGEKIERLYREVRAYAIPGGSEEIMADLGVRQSLKMAQMVNLLRKRADAADPAKAKL